MSKVNNVLSLRTLIGALYAGTAALLFFMSIARADAQNTTIPPLSFPDTPRLDTQPVVLMTSARPTRRPKPRPKPWGETWGEEGPERLVFIRVFKTTFEKMIAQNDGTLNVIQMPPGTPDKGTNWSSLDPAVLRTQHIYRNDRFKTAQITPSFVKEADDDTKAKPQGDDGMVYVLTNVKTLDDVWPTFDDPLEIADLQPKLLGGLKNYINLSKSANKPVWTHNGPQIRSANDAVIDWENIVKQGGAP